MPKTLRPQLSLPKGDPSRCLQMGWANQVPNCRLLGDPGGIEARGAFSRSSHVQSSKGPKARQHGRLQGKKKQ